MELMNVEENRVSHIGLIFILGLISMLMPLAIDMYLPSMPVIAQEFGVPAGSVQMTLSAYVLGFAVGQLFYGPMADSLGRKPVIFWGVLILDRKSTRLNSSHITISYAVFCLKKKK